MAKSNESAKSTQLTIASKKRKRISIDNPELVSEQPLTGGETPPLMIQPVVPGLTLFSWCRERLDDIEQKLLRHGAVLFRRFNLASLEEFRAFMTLFGKPMKYGYRSTPRSEIANDIYTATEYPASESIPLHNEMSYSRHWPSRIGFYCRQPASAGGHTPICDSRRVLTRIPPEIRQTFQDKGLRYVRNYQPYKYHGFDLSWRDAFQAVTKAEVEALCNHLQLEFRWTGERLTTSQNCQIMIQHPTSSEWVWFNQAHLFHISSLPEQARKVLLDYSAQHLPRNVYHTDGSSIDEALLSEVRLAYQLETINFAWQQGDILLLDNLLTAHGRTPYKGQRQVVVCMVH